LVHCAEYVSVVGLVLLLGSVASGALGASLVNNSRPVYSSHMLVCVVLADRTH